MRVTLQPSGTIQQEELPTEESGYETLAAVVYERRGRWFRIAVPRGSAWIERANTDDFLPYPQLLARGMAYLRNDWDGQLRQTAGFGSPAEVLPLEWKERIPTPIDIEVLTRHESVTTIGFSSDSQPSVAETTLSGC